MSFSREVQLHTIHLEIQDQGCRPHTCSAVHMTANIEDNYWKQSAHFPTFNVFCLPIQNMPIHLPIFCGIYATLF